MGHPQNPDRPGEQRAYRDIVESLSHIIYRIWGKIDGDLENIEFLNDRSLQLLGYSAAELTGSARNWFDLLHPSDIRKLLDCYERIRSSGTEAACVYRIRCRDGSYRWLEDMISVVPAEDLRRFQGVVRDVTDSRLDEEAHLSNETRLKAIVDSEPECVKTVSADGRLLEMNPAGLRMLGAEKAEQVLGRPVEQLLHPEDKDPYFQLHHAVLSGASGSLQFRMYTMKGQVRWMESNVVPLRETSGAITAALSITRDITERKRSEILQSALYRIAEKTTEVGDLQEFYRALHGIISELMYAKNFYIALYDEAAELMHYPYFVDEYDQPPAPEKLSKSLTSYVFRTGKPLLATPERFRELIHQGEVGEYGSDSLDWLGVPLKSGDRTCGVLVVQSYRESFRYGEKEKDILTFVSQHIATALERKRAEELIRHQAYHDGLTRLPNRMLFQDRFAQALARAHRNQEMLAMLFLDLDRFKTINDTLGHAVGDQLLQEVAERLTNCLREGDTVARLGGDEFMVMLTGVKHTEDVAGVARKLLHAVRPPFHIQGHELNITTSIGISFYPHDGQDADTLVKNADVALYRAKESGRDNYQHYMPSMNERALERLTLENNLRRALERGEFVVHYQPQIDVASGQVIGMEALVRWKQPDGSLLLPGDFIKLAEDTGLIVALSEWVMRTACRQVREWQEMGLPACRISVNLSARHFHQKDLVETVERILKETGLDPQYLELELTESILMHDIEAANATMRELKARGIHISIDDFGTGYSSLSYLKRFPVNTLKVDQSFVRDCIEDSDDAAIVSAIVSMARSLKMKVTAEGVETREQLDFLRTLQCDSVQGFYFNRPVSPEEIAEVLRRKTAAPKSEE